MYNSVIGKGSCVIGDMSYFDKLFVIRMFDVLMCAKYIHAMCLNATNLFKRKNKLFSMYLPCEANFTLKLIMSIVLLLEKV